MKLLLLLIYFQTVSYISVLPSFSLVPICCEKNETEVNCILRIEQSGALFDVGSWLVPGYQCLVDIKYDCYDIEIREHGRIGQFTFEDATYDITQYCFNNEGQFCIFHCIIPICCSEDLEDRECINKFISENGNIVIPNNSVTTNCSGHKIEICVDNEEVTQNNGFILKNNNTLNPNKDYCIKILNSEGNCEDICWDYSLVPVCCHKDETKENCKLRMENSVAHFDIYSVLVPGYTCLVDNTYECHDIEIVKYERSGKLTFNDVTYNKDQYCVNSKGEFCILRCTISICCAIGYEDFECIKKYVLENGTMVIPIIDKGTKCPGHTMEIWINDEQVTVQDNDIILKNWEEICWKNTDISNVICYLYEGESLPKVNVYSNAKSLESPYVEFGFLEYLLMAILFGMCPLLCICGIYYIIYSMMRPHTREELEYHARMSWELSQ